MQALEAQWGYKDGNRPAKKESQSERAAAGIQLSIVHRVTRPKKAEGDISVQLALQVVQAAVLCSLTYIVPR